MPVGRTAELAELTSTGIEGTVLISALAGTGGIGKTALALWWAHQHLHRFPDGQLFVDLRGISPAGAPVDSAVAVRGFLDAFGVDPGRIPADLAAQGALYRGLVAGRRMLIVLDNAADAAQVVPLLPGRVIVTSRRHLTRLVTRHGARHLKLDVLTDDDASHLLTTRIGADRVAAEPTATGELLACCGGFALALDIVGARAAMARHISLTEIAAELRDDIGALDDEDPAASLPAVLSWSLRALTCEQRIVFTLLSIAPGPDIGLPAAASLTGLPRPRTRAVLRILEDASLLDRHPGGRYIQHDLLRAFATRQDVPECTRQAALRRVLDFHIHTARAAELLLAPNRPTIELDPPAPGAHPHPLPDASAAMAWFELEYPSLLVAQCTAARLGWHQSGWQLAWTLDTFLARRGHRRDRLAVWLTALAAAAHLPEPSTSIRALQRIGRVLAELGRHEEGSVRLYQALALAEHHDDADQQAHALPVSGEREIEWAELVLRRDSAYRATEARPSGTTRRDAGRSAQNTMVSAAKGYRMPSPPSPVPVIRCATKDPAPGV